MKTKSLIISGAIGCLAALSVQAQVTLKVYNDYTENFGSNIQFDPADLVGTLDVPNVLFGVSQGNFNWHPFGLADFGAVFTGTINTGTGDFLISLFSDDGSYMFIDGILQISRPGAHGPDSTSKTIHLDAGLHTFEVQFFECCSGQSGVDAVLPEGIEIVQPPNGAPDVGSTVFLFGTTLSILGIAKRRLL
jgi:hypothetical protein